MGFLLSAIGADLRAETPNPSDDFWYTNPGTPAVTGHKVTPELAMSVSTVYAATRVRSTVLAMLPKHVYRNRPDGRGKERLRDHRLQSVLDRPNRWQTGFQFAQMAHGHVVLRGNAYAEIVPGPRGFADQLIPLHPACVEVTDQRRDGTLVYEYRPPSGEVRIISGEWMHHLMGPSTDGIRGLSVVELMRNSVGLALATQEHGGRMFGNAPMMKGLLKQTAGRALDEQAEQQLTRSFARAHSGSNANGVAYMPPGLEWESVGMSNEDAQFLQTRAFQVEDLLRFLCVPGVLVGHADKTATYASAEQFFQSFFTFHLDPDFVMWEQAISRDLIAPDEQGDVFAEFVRAGLMRGDATSRSNFYRAMIELGVMTRNEARSLENLNPLDGLDEPLTPMNMQQGRAEEGKAPPAPEPLDDDQGAHVAYPPHVEAIVTNVAARLARMEVAELGKAATKYASQSAGWTRAVSRFYEKYAGDVSRGLALDPALAAAHCAERRERLLAEGPRLLEAWEQEAGAGLASQALERAA